MKKLRVPKMTFSPEAGGSKNTSMLTKDITANESVQFN